MWSRIPEALPRDLRGNLLEFLGPHPTTVLARVAQRLFRRSPRTLNARRHLRWGRYLRWKMSSTDRRIRLLGLAVASNGVVWDPRDPARAPSTWWYSISAAHWIPWYRVKGFVRPVRLDPRTDIMLDMEWDDWPVV